MATLGGKDVLATLATVSLMRTRSCRDDLPGNVRLAWKWLGTSAGVCFLLWSAGCREPIAPTEALRPVRVIQVGDLQAIKGREFPGRAAAKDEVDLSFQVSGSLVALPVDVGSEVEKGDLIASLDPRDFVAALDTAQANLDRARANLLAMERGARPEEIKQLQASVAEAEATYRQAYTEHQRNTKLIESGTITQAEFDLSLARAQRTLAQLKKAREDLNIGTSGARPEDLEAKRSEIRALAAAVANAKNQLDYTVLNAPFEGRVAARYVDNYQTVQAKQPIVRLLDVSKIEITIQVPESLITLVPQVESAVCRFDAIAGREFAGRVTKIGSEASQTTRTYPVTVEVEQPDEAQILPGMAATVRANPEANSTSATAQLIVPPSAIFTAGENRQSYVWVVEGEKAVRRPVKTGHLTAVGREIDGGLKPGELVVTTGVHSLRENQPVSILREGKR